MSHVKLTLAGGLQMNVPLDRHPWLVDGHRYTIEQRATFPSVAAVWSPHPRCVQDPAAYGVALPSQAAVLVPAQEDNK